jgi:hypothetical protein
MFIEGAFRRLLNLQIALQTYEDRLNTATTPEEFWHVTEAALKEFGFNGAHMSLGGQTFTWDDSVYPIASWDVTVPIGDLDFVRLTCPFGASGQPNVVAALADILRKTLTAKSTLTTTFSMNMRSLSAMVTNGHPSLNTSDGARKPAPMGVL